MSDGNVQVPMLGTGVIIDLGPEMEAIKTATNEKLGEWYAAYYKPVMETFGMVREELLARMLKNKQSLLPLPNGLRIEVDTPTKRECRADGLHALEATILEKFKVEIPLVREKVEIAPDMRGIKKARKLGDEISGEIDKNLLEVPGRPRLKVEGITEARKEKAFGGE